MKAKFLSLVHPSQYKKGALNRTRAALAELKASGWSEHLHRLEALLELCEALPEDALDTFFTPNAFGKKRRLEHVAQFNALFVDLDPVLPTLFQEREFVLGEIRALVPAVIPEPNLLVSSGRGHWLLWLLEPTPPKALPLWQKIEDYLVRSLAHLGADPKAKDVTRVMRVPGTINSKTGKRVTYELLHENRYRLDDLAEQGYLIRKPRPEGRMLSVAVASKPRSETPVHRKLFSLYSLHWAVLQDLQRLADMRGRKLKGHREYFLFIWRNCLVRLGQSPAESERQLRSVALQYLGVEQIPEKEWMRTTMSAYRAKHTNAQGDEETGYTLRNSWIIERLQITPEEQREMQTLIQRAEKYRRANKERKPKRAKQSREEYLAMAEDKRLEIRRLKQQHPEWSQRQIAQAANVSQKRVWAALKEV